MIRPETALPSRNSKSKSSKQLISIEKLKQPSKNNSLGLNESNNQILFGNGYGNDRHNAENLQQISEQFQETRSENAKGEKTTKGINNKQFIAILFKFQLQKMGFKYKQHQQIVKNFININNVQQISIKNIKKWVLSHKSQIVQAIMRQKQIQQEIQGKQQKIYEPITYQQQTVRNPEQKKLHLKIQQAGVEPPGIAIPKVIQIRPNMQTLVPPTQSLPVSYSLTVSSRPLSPKQPSINFRQQRQIICPICLVETRHYLVRNCGHMFCRLCVKGYVQENCNNGNYIIDCPEMDCSHKIQDSQAKAVLDFNDYSRFARFKRKILLENNPDNKFCSKPDCGQILVQDKAKHLFCEVCKVTYCQICLEYLHPDRNCGQALQNQLHQAYKNFSIKKCPSCSAPIQKIDGCNHMTCKKCKTQFCWICLQKYTPYHYRIYNCCGCPGLQFEQAQEMGYKRFLQVIFFIFLPVLIAIALASIIFVLPLFMIFNMITRPCRWLSESQEMCQVICLECTCCCLPQCIRLIIGYFLLIPRSIVYGIFYAPIKYFINVFSLISSIL